MAVWPRLDDLARLPLPGSAAPGSIAFAPDGSAITYLHSTDASLVRALWWHDLESGERRMIAGPPAEATTEESLGLEEQLRRERTRTSELGVTQYAWAREAAVPTLVVPVGGQVYVAVGNDVRRGVTALEGADGVASAVVSPDGRSVAFVRDGELWICGVAGGAPRRLTGDAGDGVFNGLAEFAAAEELDRHEGLWWSADSAAIAYAHVDERHVPPFVIPHLGAGPGEPPSEQHRYPFAGGPNARVTLRISEAAGGSHQELDLGMAPDDYLARVVAEPGGGWLVAVLPRDQRSLRWLRVGRDGAARELWVERSEPWLNLDNHTRVLRDGRVLRSTERTGYRHLELRTADGPLERQLTGGEWVVTDVAHVDEDRGEVLFLATRHGGTERHLYAAPLDAPEPVADPQRLTEDPGWHQVSVSRDGSA
ncbi:MAG TPA: DPP IV N-terminal domain-containing protein, partial [Candidatus Limnocylindria bacterium]|nr:DPP IV N-terminal domain-containing protein [Candidatus Limnocylindria bacterium]